MNADPSQAGLKLVIRIAERLGAQWAGEFEGLEVQPAAAGGSELAGWLADQAALMGILERLHNLNLTIFEVRVGDEIKPEE